MKTWILIIVLAFTAGCASNGSKKAEGVPGSEVYVKNYKSLSLERDSAKVEDNCPRTKNVWQSANWQAKINFANACLKKGSWSAVEEIGLALAQEEYAGPWGAYYLSLVSEKNGNLERALWMINLALKKSPNVGLLQYQKARIDYQQKHYELAVNGFERALELGTGLIEPHLFLGQIYLRDQSYNIAQQHFEKVLVKQQSNAVALSGMYEISLIKRNNDKAMEFAAKLVASYPKDTNYRMNYARLLEEQDSLQMALEQYEHIKFKLGFNSNSERTLVESKIKELKTQIKQAVDGTKVSQRQPSNSEQGR